MNADAKHGAEQLRRVGEAAEDPHPACGHLLPMGEG